MRIVCWNLERKRSHTPTGAAAVARIAAEDPELAVLTEARIGHLESFGGYEVTSEPPAGERFGADERKVVAWSQNLWRDVDCVGDERMPIGRFVAGTTTTSIGDVRLVAICIPWHMCDVRYGSKDRKPWEQHLRWLEYFGRLIGGQSSLPVVVAGDFNQRIPSRSGARRDVVDALASSLDGFDVVTSGVPPGGARQGIDHIAINHHLRCASVRGWANDDGGTRMSDHDGVVADLHAASQASGNES